MNPLCLTVFPTIESLFQFQQSSVNQSVTLFCLVAGYPIPTITWQHNRINVDSDSRVRAFLFGYGSSSKDIFNALMAEVRMPSQLEVLAILRISSVKLVDMGHYTCTATNLLLQTTVMMEVFSAGYLVAIGTKFNLHLHALKNLFC